MTNYRKINTVIFTKGHFFSRYGNNIQAQVARSVIIECTMIWSNFNLASFEISSYLGSSSARILICYLNFSRINLVAFVPFYSLVSLFVTDLNMYYGELSCLFLKVKLYFPGPTFSLVPVYC